MATAVPLGRISEMSQLPWYVARQRWYDEVLPRDVMPLVQEEMGQFPKAVSQLIKQLSCQTSFEDRFIFEMFNFVTAVNEKAMTDAFGNALIEELAHIDGLEEFSVTKNPSCSPRKKDKEPVMADIVIKRQKRCLFDGIERPCW